MRHQAPHFPQSVWGRLKVLFTSQLPALARAQARARATAEGGPDLVSGGAWGPIEEAVFARFAGQAARHRERVRARARAAWDRANVPPAPAPGRAPAPPGRGSPGQRRKPRVAGRSREQVLAACFASDVWPRLGAIPTWRLEAAARACARARQAGGRPPDSWGAEEERVCARYAAAAERGRLTDRVRRARLAAG
jgi:hypothetical protein